ncbi:DegV family protein [Kandleria vitulina]|nr:DegV family protein [Kandleria vitulina]
MMKIITDTSALYSKREADAIGIDVLPLLITINNKTYTEFEDIMPDELLEMIKEGGVPTSSQPSLGRTLETLEKYDEDIIVLNMADGLSGTYATTCSAKDTLERDNIHVINTMTLCGPHRYLVDLAVKLRDEGKSTQEIINEIHKCMSFSKSFLIPVDFSFLKRGGRLSPLAAKLGGMLKIVPVLELTRDGKSLDKFAIKKSEKGAVKAIIKEYQSLGVNENCKIYVTHAGALDRANRYKEQLSEAFPGTEIEIIELSPVFITHGGPGCIAIQMIGK